MSEVRRRDLLDADRTADPYPYLAELRANDPVHWDPDQRAWLFTRYADVAAAFTDPRLSSDRIRPLLDVVTAKRRAELAPMLGVMSDWMVVTDPPVHTRLRKLANAAFRQQRIAHMPQWIGKIVDDLLDEFTVSGSTDFVGGLAYPMPATVIAKMLGAPARDRDLFQRWSDELALVAFGAGGAGRNDRHWRALAGVAEMQQYLHDLIADVDKDPGEDMISALLENPDPDDGLSRDELVALCSLILFAGHETTTNLLCNAIVALIAHPGQLAGWHFAGRRLEGVPGTEARYRPVAKQDRVPQRWGCLAAAGVPRCRMVEAGQGLGDLAGQVGVLPRVITGDQRGHPGVGDDVGDLAGGEPDVDRYRGHTRQRAAEQDVQQVEGIMHHDADPVVGRHTEPGQAAGHGQRAGEQFRVRLAVVVDDKRGARTVLASGFRQQVQDRNGIGTRGHPGSPQVMRGNHGVAALAVAALER
jgi:hypothetical protein